MLLIINVKVNWITISLRY